jgi:hypothetical protein
MFADFWPVSGCIRSIEVAKTRSKTRGKREVINTGRDKRYVRRDAQGQFKESDDVSRSLASDRRQKAKTTARSGQGDKGDRKRKS